MVPFTLPAPAPFPSRPRRRGRGVLAAAVACALFAAIAAGLLASPGPARASIAAVQQRLSGEQSRNGALRQGIGRDTNEIDTFQGNIDALQSRLGPLDSNLMAQDHQLSGLQSSLSAARARMSALAAQLLAGRHALAAQLIANYENGPPSVAEVILQSQGFVQMLEQVRDVKLLLEGNAQTLRTVAADRRALAAQAARLAPLEASQALATDRAFAQRNEVARLKLAVVQRQLVFVRARDRRSAQLSSLTASEQALNSELAKLALEAAAQDGPLPAGTPGLAGNVPPYESHPGPYGFFPAPGTNYTVNEEPELEARLDALGRDLHLTLIGISGYRTPAHSVAVGGFADDPHTRGEASDTPGVEGVPESILAQFGLERPFPGAREADHIQLLGSPL